MKRMYITYNPMRSGKNNWLKEQYDNYINNKNQMEQSEKDQIRRENLIHIKDLLEEQNRSGIEILLTVVRNPETGQCAVISEGWEKTQLIDMLRKLADGAAETLHLEQIGKRSPYADWETEEAIRKHQDDKGEYELSLLTKNHDDGRLEVALHITTKKQEIIDLLKKLLQTHFEIEVMAGGIQERKINGGTMLSILTNDREKFKIFEKEVKYNLWLQHMKNVGREN